MIGPSRAGNGEASPASGTRDPGEPRRFELERSLVAGILTGFTFVVADVVGREHYRWRGASFPRYALGSLGLYVVAGVTFGAVVWVLSWLGRRLSRPEHAWSRRWAFPGVVGGLAATGAAWPIALEYAGSTTRFGSHAGILQDAMLVVAALGGAVLAKLVSAAHAIDLRRRPAGMVSASAFALLGALVQWADLTMLVALYPHVHSFFECVAAVAWMAAFSLALRKSALHSMAARRFVSGTAWIGVAWAAMVILSSHARAWQTRTLGHVWREPRYVGRMLARAQLLRDALSDPSSFGDGHHATRRLLGDNAITSTERAPIWDSPSTPSSRDVEKTRPGCARCNVVVYYVDTLRYDAAADPSIMPKLADLSRKSAFFREAFSTASDTKHALPGILSGSYDMPNAKTEGLLELSRGAGMRQALVIPQSAFEYLGKELPEFAFDETIRIPDFEPDRSDVWGYGADRPTASRIVDTAVDWMSEHRSERFFLWLFHFDVHNWRELDSTFLGKRASELGVSEEGDLNWQYRAAAASVDAELGRLVEALDAMHLSDDTILVVLSDHGEALGQGGFWVHSTFIWQSLVRVPLLFRIPGVEPQEIRERASLVDVTPTLARYLDPHADLSRYHGEDLASWLGTSPRRRRLPILLMGAHRHEVLHLGLVQPEGPWKLDVPLDSGVPELYDLFADEPDDIDFAESQRGTMLSMLRQLVTSPNFPRAPNAK
jgi:hypothetical protein